MEPVPMDMGYCALLICIIFLILFWYRKKVYVLLSTHGIFVAFFLYAVSC